MLLPLPLSCSGLRRVSRAQKRAIVKSCGGTGGASQGPWVGRCTPTAKQRAQVFKTCYGAEREALCAAAVNGIEGCPEYFGRFDHVARDGTMCARGGGAQHGRFTCIEYEALGECAMAWLGKAAQGGRSVRGAGPLEVWLRRRDLCGGRRAPRGGPRPAARARRPRPGMKGGGGASLARVPAPSCRQGAARPARGSSVARGRS